MRTLVLSLLLALPLAAYSQDSRLAKAERISRAIGLPAILVEVQASNVVFAKEQGAAMLEQLQKLGVSAELVAKVTPSYERLVVSSQTAWDPKVAAKIYADGLVDVLSDAELSAAEKYYSSPAGAKAKRALTASEEKMMKYIQEQTNKAMEPALADLMAEVKKAVQSRQK